MRTVRAEGECAGELGVTRRLVPNIHDGLYRYNYQMSIYIYEILVLGLVRGAASRKGKVKNRPPEDDGRRKRAPFVNQTQRVRHPPLVSPQRVRHPPGKSTS